jgi:alpha-L-fucosidase
MPKYLVETISYHRIRYVIQCDSPEHAKDVVTMNEAEEMSQAHIDESITDCRVIDDTEYLRVFNEDNEYLKSWTDEQKFRMIHKVDYNGTE